MTAWPGAQPIQVLALDHRDSLRVVLDPDHPARVGSEALSDLKSDILALTGDLVSGVMLDPEVGMSPPVLGHVAEGVAVIAALEAQGYLAEPSIDATTPMPDWDATRAVGCGADAVKFLALWSGRPEPRQMETIHAAEADAATAGVPLVLEPLPRRGLPAWGDWVIDWVDAHASSKAAVFKLPYPGSPDACRRVSRTLDRPWAILSAGAGFNTFAQQLQVALSNGCGGYIVGRAVWREAAVDNPEERRATIAGPVRRRLTALREMTI